MTSPRARRQRQVSPRSTARSRIAPLAALSLATLAAGSASAVPASASASVSTSALASASASAYASASAGVTISPLPGTPTALPRTQISFLGASASSLSAISVVGSRSGSHRGRLRSYVSETGASFIPNRPFAPGERVTVRARWAPSPHRLETLSSTFTIAHPEGVAKLEFPPTPGTPADVQSFQSQPRLHPPVVTVNRAGPGGAGGYVFATPAFGPGQWGPMIFDNAGRLVWFHPLQGGLDATDFRTQSYAGGDYLTWWQGRTIQPGYGLGDDVVADDHYRIVAVVKAGNGLSADEHEFTLEPDGSAYVLAYSPVEANLSSAGGPAHGLAIEGVVQQIDVRTGLVMWEWHSLGHVDVSESYAKAPALTTTPFDYFHINSLALDAHGNILISARNTWTLYQIDRRDGAISWRLGGKHSTFALGAGVQFAFQHNAAWAHADEISVFDDESAPTINPPSRGELIKLDVKARTASLAGALVRASGPLVTASQGDVQQLPNGGFMVGWGGLPNLTEFNAAGEIVYDAQFPMGEDSYRTYREPWSGQPGGRPAVVARSSAGTTAVYASWNGATAVASWQLLAGTSPAHLSAISTTPRSGFETVIPAPASQFFKVRALSPSGRVLGASQAIAG